MANSSKIMAQNEERIRTVVRIRPLSGAEVSGAHLNIISVYSGTSLRLIDPIALGVGSKALSTAEDKLYHERSFSFDVVYSATSTQEDVYEAIRKSTSKDVLVCSTTTEDIENCPETMIKKFGERLKVITLPPMSAVHSTDIIKRRNLSKTV